MKTNKKVYIIPLLFILTMFIGIDNANAGSVECYYASNKDQVFRDGKNQRVILTTIEFFAARLIFNDESGKLDNRTFTVRWQINNLQTSPFQEPDIIGPTKYDPALSSKNYRINPDMKSKKCLKEIVVRFCNGIYIVGKTEDQVKKCGKGSFCELACKDADSGVGAKPKIFKVPKVKKDDYETYLNNSIPEIQQILNWGNDKNQPDNSLKDSACKTIPTKVQELLSSIFWIITIAGIILLMVLTILEFIKVITMSSEDGFKGAFKNTLIRIICVVILLLLPSLMNWIITVINDSSGGKLKIGPDGEPFCDVAKGK